LRVLLIGGTGILSSACSWPAVERGGAVSDKLAAARRQTCPLVPAPGLSRHFAGRGGRLSGGAAG